MIVKSQKETETLLWLDMEMTGLSPERDLIVEVAAVVTGWDLLPRAEFESSVGQDQQQMQQLMDACDFYRKYPQNKSDLLESNKSAAPSQVVESQVIEFVRQNCDTGRPVILCGNSIHQDRLFIRAQWPRLDQLLHYRMLDVSSWKLVYESRGIRFDKSESHRALGDVHESIAELRFYLEYMK